MLCGISSRFQLLSPSERQVAHALLTRPPLSLPSLHPKNPLKSFVRLACVRHAASVRPEPGSNSLKYCINTAEAVSTYLRALSLNFDTDVSFSSTGSLPKSDFRNYCVRVLLTSKKSRVPFHRCLIFKVHCAVPLGSTSRSPPKQLCHFSTSIPLCQPLFSTFFPFFSFLCPFGILPRVFLCFRPFRTLYLGVPSLLRFRSLNAEKAAPS